MTIDTNPIGDVVVADELDVHPRGRTWILRWDGGDSTAMTEDEADQLARGLRALANKHDSEHVRAAALDEAAGVVERVRFGDQTLRDVAAAIRALVKP